MRNPLSNFITCLLFTPALAFAGNMTSGGGHAFSSTPEEVRAYVTGSPKHEAPVHGVLLKYSVFLEVSQLFNPDYAPNETLKRVLTALAKKTAENGYDPIEDAPLQPRDACFDHDGVPSDAATRIGQLKAPICVNVKSLSRFPDGVLQLEVLALLFHELTHQLGFGENEAIEMQNYVHHYLPLVIAADDFGGGTPLRVGGEITKRAQDGTAVHFRCTTPLLFENDPHRGGVFNKTAEIVLFSGQAIAFLGGAGGPGGVACSDQPRLSCRIGKVSDDDIKNGAKTAVDAGTMHWINTDFEIASDDPEDLLRELQRQAVCI